MGRRLALHRYSILTHRSSYATPTKDIRISFRQKYQISRLSLCLLITLKEVNLQERIAEIIQKIKRILLLSRDLSY